MVVSPLTVLVTFSGDEVTVVLVVVVVGMGLDSVFSFPVE